MAILTKKSKFSKSKVDRLAKLHIRAYLVHYLFHLNPISTEVGHIWPKQLKTAWHFHSFVARLTKIYDFVPFGTRQVPDKPFLKFFLKVSDN